MKTVQEKQAEVNAMLKKATSRFPKRMRRNSKVMGAVTRYVWNAYKAGKPVTQVAVTQVAKNTETQVA